MSVERPLTGRRVAVLGAARGIGRASATALAAAGASLAVFDLRGDHLAGLDAHHRAALDVRDEASVAAAIGDAEAALGGLDGLLYAVAAPTPRAAVDALDPALWSDSLEVNLTGAFLAARATVPALRRAGGGNIVFVASQLGSVGVPESAAYCASKGGLIQLARAMAVDHGREGIKVNTLSPGPVWTERLADRFGDEAAAEDALGVRTALGRLGTADEIAHAVLFLFGPGGGFMTGTDLVIDGGYLAS